MGKFNKWMSSFLRNVFIGLLRDVRGGCSRNSGSCGEPRKWVSSRSGGASQGRTLNLELSRKIRTPTMQCCFFVLFCLFVFEG